MPPPPPPPPPGVPPPPPASSGPPKSKSSEKGRTALLSDICKGTRLKQTSHLMVDKSKPIIGSEGKSSSANKCGTMSAGHRSKKPDPSNNFSSELQQKLLSKHFKDVPTEHEHKVLRPAPIYNRTLQSSLSPPDAKEELADGSALKSQSGSSRSLIDSGYERGSVEVERTSSRSSLSCQDDDWRHNRPTLVQVASLSCYDMSRHPSSSKSVSRSASAIQKPLCPPPPLPSPRPPTEGGPVSSSSTIGPAGGRGGRSGGHVALGNIFAGGVPRPKAMASHESSMQNGYKGNAAPRPPRSQTTTSTATPPPPPPHAGRSTLGAGQESLTGHGANGRISGLGIGGFLPPPPPQIQGPRPPPSRLPGNRAPPPPPPARGSESRSLPLPPPPAPSNGRSASHKVIPPPVPRPPGTAPPPPPPARSNLPPPPPPARDHGASSRAPAVSKPHVPPVPPPFKKNSIESRFGFRTDFPPAPCAFQKTPKVYPSALPKNSRNSGAGNRPCPPPPPV